MAEFRLIIPCVDKDVEQYEHLYYSGRNINWYNLFGTAGRIY